MLECRRKVVLDVLPTEKLTHSRSLGLLSQLYYVQEAFHPFLTTLPTWTKRLIDSQQPLGTTRVILGYASHFCHLRGRAPDHPSNASPCAA